ncbi:MAG: hypothetical protein KDI55_00020 [Anaerolineae bacterium]|nr:hypothetical protein [Anaerolineae bacterium]
MIGQLLAPIVTRVFGASVLVPVLVFGIISLTGKIVEDRREALRKEGAKQCIAERLFEAERAKAEALKAQNEVAWSMMKAEKDGHEITRRNLMEIEENVRNLEAEIAPYRELARSADSKCLSDSVRELVEGGGRKPAASDGKSR